MKIQLSLIFIIYIDKIISPVVHSCTHIFFSSLRFVIYLHIKQNTFHSFFNVVRIYFCSVETQLTVDHKLDIFSHSSYVNLAKRGDTTNIV